MNYIATYIATYYNNVDGFEDSTDYKDPPPLPPQRFDSSDVRKDGEVGARIETN